MNREERRELIQQKADALIAAHGGKMLSRALFATLQAAGYSEDSIEYALTSGLFGKLKIGGDWYRTPRPGGVPHCPRMKVRPAYGEMSWFKRFREAFEASGIGTQAALARAAGTSTQAVSTHFLGQVLPRPELRKRYALELGAPELEELLAPGPHADPEQHEAAIRVVGKMHGARLREIAAELTRAGVRPVGRAWYVTSVGRLVRRVFGDSAQIRGRGRPARHL